MESSGLNRPTPASGIPVSTLIEPLVALEETYMIAKSTEVTATKIERRLW